MLLSYPPPLSLYGTLNRFDPSVKRSPSRRKRRVLFDFIYIFFIAFLRLSFTVLHSRIYRLDFITYISFLMPMMPVATSNAPRRLQPSGAEPSAGCCRFRLRQRQLRRCKTLRFLLLRLDLIRTANKKSIRYTNVLINQLLLISPFRCGRQSILKPNAYVVTQGPNEQTVGDFWRLVWQVDASCIVMLTKTFDFIKVLDQFLSFYVKPESLMSCKQLPIAATR